MGFRFISVDSKRVEFSVRLFSSLLSIFPMGGNVTGEVVGSSGGTIIGEAIGETIGCDCGLWYLFGV